MNEKLFETINNLIQTGGDTAINVLLIYYGTTVAKFLIGFGCLYLGITKLCKTLLLICGGKDGKGS